MGKGPQGAQGPREEGKGQAEAQGLRGFWPQERSGRALGGFSEQWSEPNGEPLRVSSTASKCRRLTPVPTPISGSHSGPPFLSEADSSLASSKVRACPPPMALGHWGARGSSVAPHHTIASAQAPRGDHPFFPLSRLEERAGAEGRWEAAGVRPESEDGLLLAQKALRALIARVQGRLVSRRSP